MKKSDLKRIMELSGLEPKLINEVYDANNKHVITDMLERIQATSKIVISGEEIDMKGLTSFEVPNTIRAIDRQAFYDLQDLQYIT
jgi:hypothetical protein